ncbi:putative cyclase [Dendrothele bispora CBS 962.96]|uniref:Putative cyclase n=1 Tax=Dendrothele bispora (strain CBS 962.96) TaxID=1314807 RepID=A0A4S8LKS6_DENBC|nr:putative cyclase [Dendrothele bispora CBS 962.96]
MSKALPKAIVDLSHPLDPHNITIYPGDPALTCCPSSTVEKDGYSVTSISLGSHSGTHIDAPSHFFASSQTIDKVPLDSLVGPALIIDLNRKSANEKITWEQDLAPFSDKMKKGVILILWTGWSKYWATPRYFEYPYLDKGAAEKILETGVTVVGFDTLSPDQVEGPEGYGVHEVILGSGGIIAENLANLQELEGSDYMISLVPLSIVGCDGSPVRAFGWKVGNV